MFGIVSKCDGALIVSFDDVLVFDVVSEFFEDSEDPDLFL